MSHNLKTWRKFPNIYGVILMAYGLSVGFTVAYTFYQTYKKNQGLYRSEIGQVRQSIKEKLKTTNSLLIELALEFKELKTSPPSKVITQFYQMHQGYFQKHQLDVNALEYTDLKDKKVFNIRGPVQKGLKFTSFTPFLNDEENIHILDEMHGGAFFLTVYTKVFDNTLLGYRVNLEEFLRHRTKTTTYALYRASKPLGNDLDTLNDPREEPLGSDFKLVFSNQFDFQKSLILVILKTLSSTILYLFMVMIMAGLYRRKLLSDLRSLRSLLVKEDALKEANETSLVLDTINTLSLEKEKLEEKLQSVEEIENDLIKARNESETLQEKMVILQNSFQKQMQFLSKTFQILMDKVGDVQELANLLLNSVTKEKRVNLSSGKQMKVISLIALKTNDLQKLEFNLFQDMRELNLKDLIQNAYALLAGEFLKKNVELNMKSFKKEMIVIKGHEWAYSLILSWFLRESLVLSLSNQEIVVDLKKDAELNVLRLTYFQKGIDLNLMDIKQLKGVLGKENATQGIFSVFEDSEKLISYLVKLFKIEMSYESEEGHVKGISLNLPIKEEKLEKLENKKEVQKNVYKLY